ncbi:MAG TPA: hypothetical protein VGK52_11460 [Polyangia bacterium]
MSPSRPKTPAANLLLSIGGLAGRLELGGAPEPFLAQVRGRYGAFAMPAAPTVDAGFSLRLRFETAQPPADRAAHFAKAEAHPLTVKATDKTITIARWDLSVRLTAKRSRGRTEWVGTGRCRMSPFSLDCILRVIWSALLPREDALLVHSCGLRHAEVGVVFPGQSGLGKTTLARKAPDADDVLSDELIVIRRTASDGGWRVHGTPFWGDFARGGISMRSWPLRALAFLAQRDRVEMSPVTSSESAQRLLECMLCFQIDRPTVERNLALVTRLCSEVRSVEAQLTHSASTTEIFGKLEPHLGRDVHRQVPTFNPREMISEFRSFLRKHELYAFSPKGAGLRPYVKAGDSLLIQKAEKNELDVGDVVLYWSPGRTPDDDVLRCHRIGTPLPKGHSWTHAEVLGRVSGIARDGRSVPMPGRLDSLARLFGAQVAMPILRLAGR